MCQEEYLYKMVILFIIAQKEIPGTWKESFKPT